MADAGLFVDSGAEPPQTAGRSPVLVKVCGITTVADALSCAELGVDCLGLNFHPASPRSLSPERAIEIVAALPPTCEPIGLFVDRPPAEVRDITTRVGLRTIQLHGDEPPETLVALGDLRLIRAFRLGTIEAVARISAYLALARELGREPDAVLIDSYVPGQSGGTGHAIPRELLALLPSFPKLILAGGLTPENVAERIALAHPWMVDVASGVESSPGRKDMGKVAALLRAVRSG